MTTNIPVGDTYLRQAALPLQYHRNVVVAGCGGVGFWAALFLAMSGNTRISLFDDDKLEKHNLNRLPFTEAAIGHNKAELTAGFCNALRPESCTAFTTRLDVGLLADLHPGLIFDCTDDPKFQRLLVATYMSLRNNAQISNACRLIRAGYDGAHISVLSTMPTWGTQTDTASDYTITPSWSVPAATAAALAVAKAMFDSRMVVLANINELVGQREELK